MHSNRRCTGFRMRIAICTVAAMVGQMSPADELSRRGPIHNLPHLIKQGTATQLIVEGKPFIMLAGELHNSSASSLEYMKPIWDRLVALHLNTVLATVSWELVEPEEGEFDFSLADGLIAEARKHNLRLVFLWFGTWKNAVSSYVPAWVKRDLDRFPRAQDRSGRNLEVISCLSENACAADARAFEALMRHIREVDGLKHTVLMVQVQNESGLLGDSRDRSPLAESAFAKPVPGELMDYLRDHKETLIPEFRQVWEAAGCRGSGSWSDVFGQGHDADEVFMAWHIARYIERVARAGRAEYPLPMFANAWLIQNDRQKPGEYPSGGPVSKMLDVWRAAAPSIAIFAADIYLADFKGVCARYVRSGHPLFIPEARQDPEAAARVFYAVAEHDAICFAPFGIDSVALDHPLARSYKLLSDLIPMIVKVQGTGQMVGVFQDKEDARTVELGGYRVRINFNTWDRGDSPGFGLIIALGRGEYLIAGSGFWVHFSPTSGGLSHASILAIDELRFEKGEWARGRRLNGDESGGGTRVQLPRLALRQSPEEGMERANDAIPKPAIPETISVQRVKVYSHR